MKSLVGFKYFARVTEMHKRLVTEMHKRLAN